jgi:DNA-binding NarL/FixJ family response regulator
MTEAEQLQKPLRILLADDHALFLAGMRYMLEGLRRPVDLTEAESYDQVIAALSQHGYDLIMLDLLMPGMDGSNAIAAIREITPTTPIAIVSMLDSSADIRKAMAAGATGFIPKSSPPEVMLKAVELILSGGVYLPPAALGLTTVAHPEKPEEAPEPRNKLLTARQGMVLGELALGKSNKEIARALSLSEATVKVHVTAIMKALNAHNRTQAVIAAVDMGLVSSHDH